jgi:hypothetical protein
MSEQDEIKAIENLISDHDFSNLVESLGRELTLTEKLKYRFRSLKREISSRGENQRRQSKLIGLLRNQISKLEWQLASLYVTIDDENEAKQKANGAKETADQPPTPTKGKNETTE